MEIFGKNHKEEIEVIELLGKYRDYRIILMKNNRFEKFTDIYITNIKYGIVQFVFSITTNILHEIIDEDKVIEWVEDYKSCFEDD